MNNTVDITYTDDSNKEINDDNTNPISKVDVSSIITQVNTTTKPLEIQSNNSSSNSNRERRSFFQRIWGSCCGQRTDIVDLPEHSRKPKSYTAGKFNSTSENKTNNPSYQSSTTTSTYHGYGYPQSIPDVPPISKEHIGKKCLVLDLDETLVHSSFEPVSQAHYVIPINIEGVVHNVYVIKRPGVDEFLKRVSEHYEIMIYTASLSKYADPLLDKLDIHQVISIRLFRENCTFHDGHYVKDLSLINRDISSTIIVDNSPMSYKFHPENAIDCSSFLYDPRDVELWQIGDFLCGIRGCEDVRLVCSHWREWCKNNNNKSTVPK